MPKFTDLASLAIPKLSIRMLLWEPVEFARVPEFSRALTYNAIFAVDRANANDAQRRQYLVGNDWISNED